MTTADRPKSATSNTSASWVIWMAAAALVGVAAVIAGVATDNNLSLLGALAVGASFSSLIIALAISRDSSRLAKNNHHSLRGQLDGITELLAEARQDRDESQQVADEARGRQSFDITKIDEALINKLKSDYGDEVQIREASRVQGSRGNFPIHVTLTDGRKFRLRGSRGGPTVLPGD